METKSLNRREFLKVIGAGSMGLALAACGAPATPEPAEPEEPAAATEAPQAEATEAPAPTPEPVVEPVALTFWHPFGGSRVPLVDAIIADFQGEFPDISVEQILWTGSERMEKFVAAVAAGTPPDVIMFKSNDMPAYVRDGVFLELDDMIAASGVNPDEIYYAAEINARRYKGKTYGLPTVTAAGQHIAYYHRARFEEVGLNAEDPLETWADWEEILPLFVDNAADPPKWFGSLDVDQGNCIWEWLHLNGGSIYSDDLTQVAFNDDNGVEAMQWMHDMMWEQTDYESFVTSTYDNYVEAMRKRFANGLTAMYIAGPWMFVQFPEEHGIQIEEFAIQPMPYNAANPDAKPGAPTDGGWADSLPAGGQNPEAGFEFVKFCCVGPASLDFTLNQARPNPVKEYNEDPAYYEASPYWETVLKIMDQDYSIPVTSAWVEIKQHLSDAQDLVMYEKSAAQEALDEAAAAAQRALDKAA